ncbi:hypothetical protein [Streptomyces sp. NBC_00096]|uniref:hypothetical protein n=1 Tax=Streptomyces sp. NBC_00096 TaxID=2975650 RepID=UPI003249732E
MTTADRWHLRGSADHAYAGAEARHLLRHRLDWGNPETWFESGTGRLLGVVTNGERAKVTLLDGEGDPGEHLADPRAEGSSGGYALPDGRTGSHADRDTVTLDAAGHAVAHLIEHGTWPPGQTTASTRTEDRPPS